MSMSVPLRTEIIAYPNISKNLYQTEIIAYPNISKNLYQTEIIAYPIFPRTCTKQK